MTRESFKLLLILFLLFSTVFSLTCTVDENCTINSFCENQTSFECVPKYYNGHICNENRECLSGWCGIYCTTNNNLSLNSWYECSNDNVSCILEKINNNGIIGNKGCISDEDCSSGYFCLKEYNLCVKCPDVNSTYNELNLSNDLFCPSNKCVGIDLDCCNTDLDCKQGYFCDMNTCNKCSNIKDSICQSINCIGIDPDCCLNDNDCINGKCINNACVENLGNYCNSSLDCGNNTCIENRCILSNFVFAENVEKTIGQGSIATYSILIVNPDIYDAEISASIVKNLGYEEAYFENKMKNIKIYLKPNEKRRIYVYVYGNPKYTKITTKISFKYKDLYNYINLITNIENEANTNVNFADTFFNPILFAIIYLFIVAIYIYKNVNTYK